MKEEIAGSGNGDLLKSLVSISDAINEQIFNANQTIDGSFINRQAIIADIDPIETLKLQLEEREQEEQDNDLAHEGLSQLLEEQERIEKERRADAWMNESHTYGGQTMDATQWLATIDWFQDEDNVAAWENEFMAKTGMSRKDTKKVGGKMKRMYDLIELEAHGNVLTKEQKSELNALGSDEDVKNGVRIQREIQRNQSNIAPINHDNETRWDSDTTNRMSSFAQGMNDGGSVAENSNIKPLTPAFNQVAPDNSHATIISEVSPSKTPTNININPSLSADNMFG